MPSAAPGRRATPKGYPLQVSHVRPGTGEAYWGYYVPVLATTRCHCQNFLHCYAGGWMICELADFPGFLCAPAAPTAQKCRKFLHWLNFPQVVDLSVIVRDS
jgi:hypothetical protein